MSKNKNLAYAAGIFFAVVYVGWAFFGRGGAAPSASGSMTYSGATPPALTDGSSATPMSAGAATPPPVASTPAAPAVDERRSYALSEADVTGLPRDAAAGTHLELWVACEPPVTKAPKLQRLLKDVVLERIIPGVIPEAPSTIMLSVRADAVADLLWADRFGNLSVVVDGQ